MQFQIQIVVESDSVQSAISPESISKGTIISVNPKPQVIQAGSRVAGSSPVAQITGAHSATTRSATAPDHGHIDPPQ